MKGVFRDSVIWIIVIMGLRMSVSYGEITLDSFELVFETRVDCVHHALPGGFLYFSS
jgi:hypothetical protein